jgi:hypothetical protein
MYRFRNIGRAKSSSSSSPLVRGRHRDDKLHVLNADKVEPDASPVPEPEHRSVKSAASRILKIRAPKPSLKPPPYPCHMSPMLTVEIDLAGSYKGCHRTDGEPRNPRCYPNPSLTLSMSRKPPCSVAGVEQETDDWSHPGAQTLVEEVRLDVFSTLAKLRIRGTSESSQF